MCSLSSCCSSNLYSLHCPGFCFQANSWIKFIQFSQNKKRLPCVGDQIHTSDLYTDGKQCLVKLATKCSIFSIRGFPKREDQAKPPWQLGRQLLRAAQHRASQYSSKSKVNMHWTWKIFLMDKFIFGWISVENWIEVRFLNNMSLSQVIICILPWIRSLLVAINVWGQYISSSFKTLLRSNQFGVLCYALISHTRWLCVWARKIVPKNKAVLQFGQSSDFVRIAVSLRGSPTAQVSFTRILSK